MPLKGGKGVKFAIEDKSMSRVTMKYWSVLFIHTVWNFCKSFTVAILYGSCIVPVPGSAGRTVGCKSFVVAILYGSCIVLVPSPAGGTVELVCVFQESGQAQDLRAVFFLLICFIFVSNSWILRAWISAFVFKQF